jgi:hypothetical protein
VSSIRPAENTVKRKEQVAVLLDVSVAVQVTVVKPSWKVEPEGGLQTTLLIEQLSLATRFA